MLFNSYGFIFLFLPVTIVVYFILNKRRLTLASKAWLIITSLFFYGWWKPLYVPLILGSILFNYAIGTALAKGTQKFSIFDRKLILLTGIFGDLALLGYFKYVNFFISNINYLTNSQINLLYIVLPLGISFFTFTQIAYLVDTYKGSVKEYDLLNYSLFVTFFPHLLAGPIIHHKEMMPQFNQVRNKILNYKNLSAGLYLFSIGLFKKVIIADTFAVWANNGFDNAVMLNLFEAWATSLSYTLQLYFDFSGYTDMALGSASMFNIKLPINFNSPYKSLNIQDFWRRWHVTLSRFLRDYIYIPMGGNRVSEAKTLLNLGITFLIGGLWHGAGWTYIFWGFLHGAAMIIHRLWKKLNIAMPKILAWFLTFNFVNIAWIFFRAKTFKDAVKVLRGMLGLDGIVLPSRLVDRLDFLKVRGIESGEWLKNVNMKSGKETIFMIIMFFLVILLFKNSNEMVEKYRPAWRNAAFISLITVLGIFNLNKVSEFIYFNF